MQLYQYIRILSLDVVAGACISSLFIARLLNVDLPFSVVLALGLAVWIIYTLDHLIDGVKIGHEAGSIRHRFHQKHASTIALFLVTALAISGINLFYLPVPTLKIGMSMVILVVIYFVILQAFRSRNIFFKESSISLIYTCGLFVGPLSLSASWSVTVIPVFLQFLGLSLANLLLFSLLEHEMDKKDGHSSIVLSFGEERVKILSWMAILLVWAMALLQVSMGMDLSIPALISLMAFLLGLILLRPGYFLEQERYRIVGDGIFLIPVFLI